LGKAVMQARAGWAGLPFKDPLLRAKSGHAGRES